MTPAGRRIAIATGAAAAAAALALLSRAALGAPSGHLAASSAALAATLRVGLEGGLALVLLASTVRGTPLERLRGPLTAAVAAGLALGATTLLVALARGVEPGELAPALHRVRHLHALALLVLAVAARGRDLGALLGGRRTAAAEGVLLATALGVLLPEGAFLSIHLRDLAVLAGSPGPVALGAAAGGGAAIAIGVLASRLAARLRLAAALTPASTAALLFALELSGLAARGLDADALALALTGAISRLAHDGVHLVFVLLQVPDHAYLEDSAYQLVLRFLEPAVHAALAAVGVGIPIAVAWRSFARRPGPSPDETARAPERRAARAAFLRSRRAGALPFALAIAISSAAAWQTRGGEDALYDPIPEPVVDDGAGTIHVPLSTPLGGGDERMRKWAYATATRRVIFFTLRRPDGTLAAALDLCEVCQPKGYAQLGRGHVFCKYCSTPIPVETVGQSGGCNPVPIPGATVKAGTLLVPTAGLLSAFDRAMAGK